MTHTFEWHPIETAPKDREIMVYTGSVWLPVITLEDGDTWHGDYRVTEFTHWAEIADMVPVPSPVLSDQLGSTPLTVEEKIGPRWTTDGEYYMPEDTPAAVAFSRGWIMRGETERGEDGSAECLEEAWDRTYDELAALPSPIRKAQGDDQKEEKDVDC